MPGDHHDGLVRESPPSQDLGVAALRNINDRGLRTLQSLGTLALAHQSPQFVEVHILAPSSVLVHSEDPDAFLSEVARMVLEHVDSMVVLSSSVSSTRRVLSMLADTAVSM